MKIKPKLKNKTLAIFATLFLTLTLIVSVAPVASNRVNAEPLTTYYRPNIPFSLVEFIDSSTYDYYSVPIPTLFSYTAESPSTTHMSTNYSTVYVDSEFGASTFTPSNSNYLYGQYYYYISMVDGYVFPYVSFVASNFILKPYTNELKYSYLDLFPYVDFRNYNSDSQPANRVDISIDYCSFLNYTGGAYDVKSYFISRNFDYEDDAEYYEFLGSIINELQANSYRTFNSSTPIYILDFTLTFTCSDSFDVEYIYVTFGDSFLIYDYYLQSYDLFTATYFNADYEFTWFDSIVNSVNGFLEIEFLPGFSFGDLLFCVIAIPLAIWLLKLWLGG